MQQSLVIHTILSTSAPAKPARSSLANWWDTGLPVVVVSDIIVLTCR
jgi:hypothetical protein